MTNNNYAVNEISTEQSKNAEKILKDPRYQKIQQEIKENQLKQQPPEKVNPIDTEDKIQISQSLFNWQKNSVGDYEIKAKEKIGLTEKPDEIKFSGEKILKILGYKIDLTSRVETLKDEYMRTFIETKSVNQFLAKFYQAKLNILNVMLSFLGITSEELEELQKKGLKKAIEENIELFEQNEYNTEMFFVFGSNNRKDKGKTKVFNEVRNQLMKQMQLLGNKDFYSQEKIDTIKLKELNKIKDDLTQEQQNLLYLEDLRL